MNSPLERALAQLTIASESGSLVLVFNRDLAKLIALAEACNDYGSVNLRIDLSQTSQGKAIVSAIDALTADDEKGGGDE